MQLIENIHLPRGLSLFLQAAPCRFHIVNCAIFNTKTIATQHLFWHAVMRTTLRFCFVAQINQLEHSSSELLIDDENIAQEVVPQKSVGSDDHDMAGNYGNKIVLVLTPPSFSQAGKLFYILIFIFKIVLIMFRSCDRETREFLKLWPEEMYSWPRRHAER